MQLGILVWKLRLNANKEVKNSTEPQKCTVPRPCWQNYHWTRKPHPPHLLNLSHSNSHRNIRHTNLLQLHRLHLPIRGRFELIHLTESKKNNERIGEPLPTKRGNCNAFKSNQKSFAVWPVQSKGNYAATGSNKENWSEESYQSTGKSMTKPEIGYIRPAKNDFLIGL